MFLALMLVALGCRAQGKPALPAGAPESSGSLSPELVRRIEVLIRSKSSVPPDYTISVSARSKSDVPGFDTVYVTFSSGDQNSKPATFLLSHDNKTLAQFSQYDLSKDPRDLVSAAGRPGRGGPADAPVLIVGFDDLECPYCARMHTQLFPALTARYGDKVRVVYRDFPLDQHPWALRAAIDANCLAAQSPVGYWSVVDYIHGHAAELGGPDHQLAKANTDLDALTQAEGNRQKVKPELLSACIAKQDASAINQSRAQAETLGVNSTPALFINGEKVEGAIPIEYIYRMVDSALVAAGQIPPPAIPVPTMPGAPKAGS